MHLFMGKEGIQEYTHVFLQMDKSFTLTYAFLSSNS